MKKRRQHYVWRNYLRAWSVDEHIFCLRDGKIFKSNLMGVASKRDFYRLKDLSEADIEFVKRFVIEQSTPFLRGVHLRTLELFTLVFRVKSVLEEEGKNNPETNQKIDELVNNFEEDFHAQVEGNSIVFIDSIANKNTDFYKIKKERLAFLCFLCFQYFRTNKIKSKMISNVASSDIPKEFCIHFEKTYNIISHVFAYNVAYSLAAETNSQILLVLNHSNIHFIAGDQPVVNTFAGGKLLRKPVSELELFYPVSPRVAVLITERPEYTGIESLHLTNAGEVHRYNSFISESSYEQIYSDSQELLEMYK